MTLEYAFVAYLVLYRLAIIAAGLTAIVLGYFLFSKAAASHDSHTKEGSEVQLLTAGGQLTLRNAAPGTCFALFGAALIVWSIVASPPQLTIERLEPLLHPPSEELVVEQLKMRGEDNASGSLTEVPLSELIERGRNLEREHGIESAEHHYKEALNLLAFPLNQLAWHRLEQGEPFEAVRMAALAVDLQPDKPAYLDTLAKSLHRAGEPSNALYIMERAAKIDQAYTNELQRMREAIK